jgi:hypothetical protein
MNELLHVKCELKEHSIRLLFYDLQVLLTELRI